jgi:hypothetical protein
MLIKNIDIQNQCLLSKWLYKLINEQGISYLVQISQVGCFMSAKRPRGNVNHEY